MNKKPEEAFKSYEKYLANNPNDVHTMEVLTRMYKLGIRNDWENNKYEGRDLYKAMELANRLYKLTGNIEEVKNVLNHIYTEVNTVKDYQWAVQQILELPIEEMKMDQYADLGYLYLRLKDFTKAEESFKKATSMGHNYLYEYPLLKLYLEDFHEALVLAENIEYFMNNGNKGNFIADLKKIEIVDKTSEDYKVFRKILVSILSREDGYKEKYKTESSKIKDSILKGLMTEIAKEQNLN